MHIEQTGSIFLRDEKQLLKEKREKEISEMKRMLAEQIEEKKQRQKEEKMKLEAYEARLEASIKKRNTMQEEHAETDIIKESIKQDIIINKEEDNKQKNASNIEALKTQIQVIPMQTIIDVESKE